MYSGFTSIVYALLPKALDETFDLKIVLLAVMNFLFSSCLSILPIWLSLV